jgi:hypothetical protein
MVFEYAFRAPGNTGCQTEFACPALVVVNALSVINQIGFAVRYAGHRPRSAVMRAGAIDRLSALNSAMASMIAHMQCLNRVRRLRRALVANGNLTGVASTHLRFDLDQEARAAQEHNCGNSRRRQVRTDR